jgi:hypothetical protein
MTVSLRIKSRSVLTSSGVRGTRSRVYGRSCAVVLAAAAALTLVPTVALAQPTGAGTGGGGQAGPNQKAIAEMIKGQHAGQTGLYGTESSVTNNALAGMPLNEGGDNEKQQPDFGANSINAEKIVMQPLKGYRSMVDSDVMKDMLKELTAKKVPVLFQTYYMVENGAATGYIGGLNTVSNIISNTMETQEMQWKLLEYADVASGDRARLREAYTSKLLKNLSDEKSWPAAIYKTVGDGGKDKNANGNNKDIPKNEDEQEIFSIGDLCKQGGGGGNGNGTCKLSQLLFPQNGIEPSPLNNNGGNGGGQQFKNQGLQELSDEFVRLLGDVEFKEEGNEKYAQVLKQGFIPPQQKSVGNSGAQRRGFELKFRESLGEVWEGKGKVLYGACRYMSGESKEINGPADGAFLTTTKEIKFEDVVKASSIDAPLRANVIEQLVLISCPKTNGRVSPQCCQQLQQELSAGNLDKLLQGGQNSGAQKDTEDCSSGKLCRRMRIYLKTAIIIARSRAYQLYSKLYFEAMKFATKPDLKLALQELYRRTFPYQTVQEMIEINREDWRQHLSDIAVQANSRAVGSGTSNAVGGIAGAAAMVAQAQVDNAQTAQGAN